jgi:hypothetical protein
MATENVTVEDAIVRAAAADVKAMLTKLAETEASKDGRPADDQADPVVVVWIPGADEFLAIRVKALLDVVFEEPLRDVQQLKREVSDLKNIRALLFRCLAAALDVPDAIVVAAEGPFGMAVQHRDRVRKLDALVGDLAASVRGRRAAHCGPTAPCADCRRDDALLERMDAS